jgi:glucose/arabinose dehydrogenase/mono/diheme cytochrome c family protein
MRPSSSLSLLLLASLALPAFAQNGDVAGETQAQPTHLQVPPSPVLTAEDAIKTIAVAPGYRIEIVAADPLVGDPVAATYGPDGRLWVVEMRGFMPNPDGKGEDAKVGMIAVLEDTNHDGRMDKRTVFADGLVLPRALALVGDGLLVAEPPHLWFFRDTNGDGKADEKTEVASDYGSPANPEHTANGLLWAMDNWIYSANHNVRYRYLGNGKFAQELTVSRGQWGISQDDAGRLYHNNNSDPVRYDAVPSAYLARNPSLTDPAGVNLSLVPANLRIWPLRVTPGVNRGYKSLDNTGRITAVTAACAPLIYRGDTMPSLRGEVFVAEPSGNLIKRITLGPKATRSDEIAGRNSYEGTEFIASTDERFRPVNLLNAPDGSLQIVDMYRGIIQHRIYLTSYLRQQIEDRGLAEGLGMGRIYRIVPDVKAVKGKVATFDLTKESPAQLVSRLTSPNGWFRDTAQRLLVERRDPATVSLLRALAIDEAASAAGRLQALWTLDGMEKLDRATLRIALRDSDATVCAGAIRLSEALLAADDTEIFNRVVAARTDPKAPVAYTIILQQALSLGASRSPDALTALLALAHRHGNRPLIADAIVSGLAGRENDFIALALRLPDPGAAERTLRTAATCVWRSDSAAQVERLDQMLGTAEAPAWAGEVLLESLKALVPVRSDGKVLTAHLAAAPATLLRLAATDSPQRERAATLREHLNWPGNEAKVVTAAPLTPEQQILFDKGREVFATICAGCHQPTGLGLKGLAPSLVTSQWAVGDERPLIRVLLQGKASEGLIMPPLAALDDESLAGALTFIRRSWGHASDPVSPAAIARARQETAGRAEPWTDKELAKVRDAGSVHPESN